MQELGRAGGHDMVSVTGLKVSMPAIFASTNTLQRFISNKEAPQIGRDCGELRIKKQRFISNKEAPQIGRDCLGVASHPSGA
jgi:hypothetical protein